MKMLKAEFKSFSQAERLFIFFAMLSSFLIAAEYAIIRPVSNAVFITAYGTSHFPYAWLASVPLNFLVVALYNQFLPRLGCLKMFLAVAGAIAVTNGVCALFLDQVSWLPFFFYIWKEVYIMLMFQQLWSVIHSTVSFQRAKYLYGIFFAMGAAGSAFGSILPGFFAAKIGSEALLFATLPIYLLLACCYRLALKQTDQGIGMKLEDEEKKTSVDAFSHGFKLIFNSRYLLFILSIVILMQVSATFIDYQFNSHLERSILEKDLRTEFTGKILGIVHAATIGLQLFGSFFLIRFLGVRGSHLMIPSILGLNSLAFLLFPYFGVISFAFISVKSCDFSLFGVIREMLYIPLKPDEKFRAKAVIDVFAHRSSKALASLLILSLQLAVGNSLSGIISWCSASLFLIWIVVVYRMFKQPVLSTE